MNINIFNLIESSKLKNIDKNLSVPSALYYKGQNQNSKNLNNIVTNFTCNKNECCIDRYLYTTLLNNIKPNKEENKKMTRRRNKKNRSTRKSSKKVISSK